MSELEVYNAKVLIGCYRKDVALWDAKAGVYRREGRTVEAGIFDGMVRGRLAEIERLRKAIDATAELVGG